MTCRAGIFLLQDDKIALIERYRAGLHYYSFPGGHLDPGETPEQAAVRETKEELGLQVALRQLIAKYTWLGNCQYYYLAEATGGAFGSGIGEEILKPHSERGSYLPMWMPVAELLDQPVKPRPLAELVARAVQAGWPPQPVVIPEESR